MLIPLGFLAASGVSAGSFDLLETQVLGSSAASVTFSSLSTYASTYRHLQIRFTARSTRSDTDSYFLIQFNGDSASNYNSHALSGNGTSASSSSLTSTSGSGIVVIAGLPGSTQAANGFGAGVIDLLDPFETTKYTTARTFAGQALAYDIVSLSSGAWRNTAAVSSITLDDLFGDFAQYSRFSLYGVKG